LLVITSDALAPSVQKLVNHKNATGMPAQMMKLSQIASAQGADTPEKIKRTIANFVQNSGTRYVLLAGDPSQVPTRHRAVVGQDHVQVLSYNYTDHYYSNLFRNHNPDGSSAGVLDTWDGNGDGWFNTEYWDGENAEVANPDGVDGYPDVSVGRVPVSTTTDMDAFVNKVIAYESISFASGTPYLLGATLVQDKNYVGADTLALNIESNLTWATGDNDHLIINGTPSVGPWVVAPNASSILTPAVASSLVFYVGHGAWNQWDATLF